MHREKSNNRKAKIRQESETCKVSMLLMHVEVTEVSRSPLNQKLKAFIERSWQQTLDFCECSHMGDSDLCPKLPICFILEFNLPLSPRPWLHCSEKCPSPGNWVYVLLFKISITLEDLLLLSPIDVDPPLQSTNELVYTKIGPVHKTPTSTGLKRVDARQYPQVKDHSGG